MVTGLNILIYGGVGINIMGALLLIAYAVKYAYTFHRLKNEPVKTNVMKSQWNKKRAMCFGLIILGSLVTILGCIV